MLGQPVVELAPPLSAVVVLGTVAGFEAVETVWAEPEALELAAAAVEPAVELAAAVASR